jgi:hypothetical protein
MTKAKRAYQNFTDLTDKLLSVRHRETAAKLEAEKLAKERKKS